MKLTFLFALVLTLTATALNLAAADAELTKGVAKGTCAKNGEPAVALAYAFAFVDQKDDRKPTLLIVSDIKLPVDEWTSEFDLMREGRKYPFSGAIFFLDKDGSVFRTDFYWKGRQSSVSGYFDLKLTKKTGGEFIGTVTSAADAKPTDPKVDATLHAKVKA